MQVSTIKVTVYTPRPLPVGPVTGNTGIIHIERLFRCGTDTHYEIAVSIIALFQVTQLLTIIADEYEAAFAALESDCVG